MFEIKTSNSNTFIGFNAGNGASGGTFNTVLGLQAGAGAMSGSANTFMGYHSGFVNTTGFSNTFLGFKSGEVNSAGARNVFLGNEAGVVNSLGGSNVFIGHFAGRANTSGSNNTAVGTNAGDSHNNSSNCTFVGNTADASTNNRTNATALGNGASVNLSNKVRIGNTAVATIEGQVAYTFPSDGRFKNDIKTDAPGLDFVLGLQPVTYNFDYTKFSKFLHEKSVDYGVLKEKEQQREMGFVAQDVEVLCREQGVPLNNLVHVPEDEHDNYSLAYSQLVVPLVKAVQEQQAQIEKQQADIEMLKNLVLTQQTLIAEMRTASIGEIPGFQLFPNPASNQVNIELSRVPKNATLQLTDAKGISIRSLPVAEGLQTLDMSALPAGTYFLQLFMPQSLPRTHILLKTN
jgi:hypothetical protein